MARVCVITGAGRGIGRALAVHVATAGYNVAVCSRTADELTDTLAEVERAGGRGSAHTIDVSDVSAVDAFAGEIAEQHGPAWAVVNNAAVLGPVGPIDTLDLDRWMHALAVDVGGVVAVTRAFVRQMRGTGGRIINLSGAGIGGSAPQLRVSAYAASKGAVDALTEVLAGELEGDGITVNALAPGLVATSFLDDVLRAGPELAGPELHADAVRNRDAPVCLDSFFELVDFLLGDQSTWLTGKLIAANWDRVSDLIARRDQLMDTSLLTLRRIDDERFTETE